MTPSSQASVTSFCSTRHHIFKVDIEALPARAPVLLSIPEHAGEIACLFMNAGVGRSRKVEANPYRHSLSVRWRPIQWLRSWQNRRNTFEGVVLVAVRRRQPK